jgi:hypothetical protein
MIANCVAFLLILVLSAPGLSQDAPAADADFTPFTAEELVDIVGPVALYPDSLLGHVLAASTLPDEIAVAVERITANGGEADENDEALQALDPQVQALFPFLDVLEMMNDFPDWTAELADATAFQQEEVLDAIQTFRRQASEAGNLESNEQVTVVVEERIIQIQPTDPQVIFVPVYQPTQVIVRQPSPVITFTAGVIIGSWIWGGSRWGWGGVSFHSRTVVAVGGGRWRRPPRYRPRPRPRGRPPAARPGGRPGSRPGGARTGGGNRPGTGGRPNAGNRPGTGGRPNAGNRPGTGDRPNAGNRPSAGGGGARPNTGNRPSAGGGGARPNAGNRPSAGGGGARPSTGNRPSAGANHRSGGAFNSRQGGSSARQSSARGASSRSGARSGGGRSGGGRSGGGGRRR